MAASEGAAAHLGAVVDMHRALLLLALPDAAGFAFREPRARWTMPYDALSQKGLSRKLKFAVDPQFCSTVKPRFIESMRMSPLGLESSLVRCEELQETLIRAFNAWGFNNKRIGFYNVTFQCSEAELASQSCAEAEIFISARAPQNEAETKQIAVTSLATSAEPPIDTADPPKVIEGEHTITQANITFMIRDGACYYLDDRFCKWIVERDYNVNILMIVIFVAMEVVGWALLFWRGYVLLRQRVKYGKEKMLKVLLSHLSHIHVTWTLAICIIFPIAGYAGLFNPCLGCYSFEGITVHHVGVSLGLAPLDSAASVYGNVTNRGPMMQVKPLAVTEGQSLSEPPVDEQTCQLAHLMPPLADSLLEPIPDWSEGCSGGTTIIGNHEYDYEPWTCGNRTSSVMLQPSPYHNRACLGKDDLDALNFLYPSCKGANLDEGGYAKPICVRSERNHIYINFVLMAGLPFICVAMLTFGGLLLARRHQRIRMRKAKLMEHCLLLWGDKAKAIFDRTDEEKKRKRQMKADHARALVEKLHLPDRHKMTHDSGLKTTFDPSRHAKNRRFTIARNPGSVIGEGSDGRSTGRWGANRRSKLTAVTGIFTGFSSRSSQSEPATMRPSLSVKNLRSSSTLGEGTNVEVASPRRGSDSTPAPPPEVPQRATQGGGAPSQP